MLSLGEASGLAVELALLEADAEAEEAADDEAGLAVFSPPPQALRVKRARAVKARAALGCLGNISNVLVTRGFSPWGGGEHLLGNRCAFIFTAENRLFQATRPAGAVYDER